ncbi:MAG TPA: carbohydrate ABC transporter permease, partial [Candidatus Pelethocola excrementipullorum]|nr:carbohydrate ABC transporter permease [Candidatus Pelethocola excrementipullorum]
MKQNKVASTLIFALCIMISLIVLLPLFLMILTSLKSTGEINAESFVFIPEKLLFSNYVDAMRKGNWFIYFKNTVIVTAITVIISLIINSLAGYAFARIPFKGRDVLFFIAMIGMMIPGQVTMIPVFTQLKTFPLAGGNNILGAGGTGLINTYAGLILPYIAGAFGVFLCRQYYMGIPQALDEAAKIDGCSRMKAYVYIFLPNSKSILATLAVLKASQTWNDYIWPLIMISNDSKRTVQVALVNTFVTEVSTNWNLLMAGTTIVMLPLVILFLFTQKYFVE